MASQTMWTSAFMTLQQVHIRSMPAVLALPDTVPRTNNGFSHCVRSVV